MQWTDASSVVALLGALLIGLCPTDAYVDKKALKQQAHEMFMHGYRSYMDHAYPADELMPLSCRGRVRGITPSRGDVDDSLGNFSLTLVDTLDTLVVMGEIDEFERAVKLVVENVQFNSDLVVSVFETNIRMLGGLISAHLMSELVRERDPNRLKWYTDKQLLRMAVDLADRLLPAFNTTSGLPFSRINLRHGMQDHLKRQKDTCTACGGTMLLEMAALSRLTGNPLYEQKARKAMDFLWMQRHRASDLMGTVLDVHSGNWVRRDSGIGAGIDSYYEYCLKAFILLGEYNYLERFNRHYDAVMRYVSKGPLFFDVQMHRPTIATRSFMDSLLAFWPGLQVLKGDVAEAVQMHEMLFQVVQKHKFLPEAFTHDLQVHWAEHPLRPEFIESTYFLYRATKDPHYLDVARQVMESLNENVRVPCGWAGVKDIRIMTHEDRMDSFVLSETFKYLYMIFSEPSDLIFDPDNFVLTTEAHFLPLSIGDGPDTPLPRRLMLDPDERLAGAASQFQSVMPIREIKATLTNEARAIRERTQGVLEELAILQKQSNSPQAVCSQTSERLRAWSFSATNEEHIRMLADMGITISTQADDNKILLTHQAAAAKSAMHAVWGQEFMAEVVEIAKQHEANAASVVAELRMIQVLSAPFLGVPILPGTIAQFGIQTKDPILARGAIAEPIRACTELTNADQVRGRIVLIERSDCTFHQKAVMALNAGARAAIIIDHSPTTSYFTTPSFVMSGEKGDEVDLSTFFLFRKEGEALLAAIRRDPSAVLRVAVTHQNPGKIFEQWLRHLPHSFIEDPELCSFEEGLVVRVLEEGRAIEFAFRFQGVNTDSDPIEHQAIVERHIRHVEDIAQFETQKSRFEFLNMVRTAAYGSLGLAIKDGPADPVIEAMSEMTIQYNMPDISAGLTGPITRVRCNVVGELFPCITTAR